MPNNGTTIQKIHFLRAVAATQPTADNPKGSTIKKLKEKLLHDYPTVLWTDIQRVRTEAIAESLVVMTGYHHSLTDIGTQELNDLEAKMAAEKTEEVPA